MIHKQSSSWLPQNDTVMNLSIIIMDVLEHQSGGIGNNPSVAPMLK